MKKNNHLSLLGQNGWCGEKNISKKINYNKNNHLVENREDFTEGENSNKPVNETEIVYIKVRFEDTPIELMIDTGASIFFKLPNWTG